MKSLAREADQNEIVRRLALLGPEQPRLWGRMSAHQMVCHLNDSFLAVTGKRDVSPATGPIQRTLVKWLALYAPLRWPVGVMTRPEIDQEIGGTRPSAFASDLSELEALLRVVTTRPDCFDGHTHPIFGPMSRAQWMRWAYLHMDHHLRQFGV